MNLNGVDKILKTGSTKPDLLENAIAKYGNKLEIFRIVTNDRGIALKSGKQQNM